MRPPPPDARGADAADARAAPPTIGLCEDDDELRGLLRDALRREGIVVRPTVSGAEALDLFTRERPDVLVLDIGLPDADGRDVCRALRARGVDAPVLFLTARGSVSDRVSGFRAGGDDYLAKPFSLAELLVRVHALLRRRPAAGVPAEPAGGFVVDQARHAVRRGDREEILTPTEYRVLTALVGAEGDVVYREALISAAWPDGAVVRDNTLCVSVARVRRKLRRIGAPAELESVRGAGYRLR
jgi:two-component system, OmpR family, response regulator